MERLRLPPSLVRLLPAFAWLGFISYWSSQSNVPIEGEWFERRFHGWQSPLAHAAAFGILGGLLRLGLRGTGAMLLAAALTSVGGALDEWHQSFTPGREVELTDWIVDTAAGATGALVASLAMAGRWTGWGSALPRMRGSYGLAAALAAVVLVAVTPVGRPVRAAVRNTSEWTVPHRVRAVPAEVASATREVARRVRNKVGGLFDG